MASRAASSPTTLHHRTLVRRRARPGVADADDFVTASRTADRAEQIVIDDAARHIAVVGQLAQDEPGARCPGSPVRRGARYRPPLSAATSTNRRSSDLPSAIVALAPSSITVICRRPGADAINA